MCVFYTEDKLEDEKKVSGYKVAIKNKETGKYYSPATFIEYKKGEIPKLKYSTIRGYIERRSKFLAGHPAFGEFYFNDNFCLKGGQGYAENMAGKTAIFSSSNDAIELKDNIEFTTQLLPEYEYVILKMSISGDMYYGSYNCSNVYIGTRIEKLEEVIINKNK